MIPLLMGALMLLQTGSNVKDTFTTATPGGMPVESITALTTDAKSICVDGNGTAVNCWLDVITISVTASSAQSVTLANGAGTWTLCNTNSTFPAGASATQYFPGGAKFTGGLTATAAANSSVILYVRGIRARGTDNAHP